MSRELAALIRERTDIELTGGEKPEFNPGPPITPEELEALRDGGFIPTAVDSWEALWEDYYAFTR